MIFTMRPSYVQGKQPQQQKAWFLEIWPCMGEKEKSRKWTEWMEGWWMSFSFCLSIYAVGPVVAVPKLWFLHSCLRSRSGLICAKWQSQFGGTVVALCFYNFKSGTLAKTSKSAATWWLAPYSSNMPLAVKCWINNQKSRASHTQHRTGSPWENWWPPTTSQLYFHALHDVHLQPF